MTGSPYAAALTLAVGSVLVCAITVLWVTSTRSVIRVVAIQGVALGLVAMILGIHLRDAGLIGAATVVLLVKGAAIPLLLGKASGTGTVHSRESRPIVNVPASLVASVFLIVLAFAAFRDVARFVGTTAGALVPVGVATLLIGFSRRGKGRCSRWQGCSWSTTERPWSRSCAQRASRFSSKSESRSTFFSG